MLGVTDICCHAPLFPEFALMEYEPVCAFPYTIPALAEVLHEPAVSNPGFCTRFPPSAAGSETAAHKNTQIDVAGCFIIVWG